MTDQELEQVVIDRLVFATNLSRSGAYGEYHHILSLFKQAKYVRLAKDQTFPLGIRAVEKTLKERGWRKVELGEGN